MKITKWTTSILLCGSLMICSCSFNKMYLQPTKIPNLANQTIRIDKETGDTLVINISENYQPTFVTLRNGPANLPYKIESVVFENIDKTPLNGWVISPKASDNGRTILFFHGNAGNLFGQYELALPFVKRGFQVFIFDYSGFGFSEGEATRSNVLKDGRAAFQFIHEREQNSNRQLIIYGQSLGGHLAPVIASEFQEQVDALVVEGAFSSHKDIAAHRASILGRIFVAEKYSAVESIKKLSKPVLVIHSTEDKTIPFKQGQKLFRAANQPKTFYEIDKPHMMGPIFYADSIISKLNSTILAGSNKSENLKEQEVSAKANNSMISH